MGWGWDDVKSAASGAKNWVEDRYDDVEGIKADVGRKIDSGVDKADRWLDDGRKDIVKFGEDHGGLPGKLVGQAISNNIGSTQGALLGAYDMTKGVVTLVDGVQKLTNPIEWSAHSGDNLKRLQTAGTSVVALGNLGNPVIWAANPGGNANTVKGLWNGLTSGYQDAAKNGDYSKMGGRLAFDVGSMFIGAGEANAAIKGTSAAAKVGEAASTAGKVSDAAHAAGAAGNVGKGAEAAGTTRALSEVGELPKAGSKLGKLEDGQVLVGRSTSIMREHAARVISETPNHPLRFLINPETNKFWTRGDFGFTKGYKQSDLFDNPVLIDMGHITSNKALTNGGDRIMLQSVFENQWNNLSVESSKIGGHVVTQRAVSVDGIAVSFNDVKMWTELKVDANMAQRLAKFGYKEGDTFLPKSILDTLVNVP